MTMAVRVVLLLALLGAASAVSPVQKVIQLIDEMKAKMQKDLAAENAAMDEYMAFCREEFINKGLAIENAGRSIDDLSAKITDYQATIASTADKITDLGTEIAGKEKELAAAGEQRKAEQATFQAAEAELIEAVDETSRAVTKLGGASFTQVDSNRLQALGSALSLILRGEKIDAKATKKQLHALLQASSSSSDGLDLSTALHGPPKAAAFEAHTGGILETVKAMNDKAEDQLEELRKQDMKDGQSFALVSQGLNSEVEHAKGKLADATSLKSSSQDKLGQAEQDLVDTKATKAEDEKGSAQLKRECEAKSGEWETRQVNAKEELAAIDKAKEILQKGVVALVQMGTSRKQQVSAHRGDGDDRRARTVTQLRDLGKKYHSFKLVQIAQAATADPFVKVRSLIENMIDKLVKEGEAEATKEAFCNEEMGKSEATLKEKGTKKAKHQARMDEAMASIAELKAAVSTLESEIAEIDKAQKEANAIRSKEKSDNTQAMKDFKQSSDAVSSAIGVLRDYYEGASLIQQGDRVAHRARQPSFGGTNGDAGAGIIDILEQAESDFTKLYSEVNAEETAASTAYDKFTQENKVARATKEVEAKGKTSEMKSLEVTLSQSKEDHAAVASEIDAVTSYVEKLKPECETKVMSYEERVAARKAEIEGLKEALATLEGKDVAMLFQEERHLRGSQ